MSLRRFVVLIACLFLVSGSCFLVGCGKDHQEEVQRTQGEKPTPDQNSSPSDSDQDNADPGTGSVRAVDPSTVSNARANQNTAPADTGSVRPPGN